MKKLICACLAGLVLVLPCRGNAWGGHGGGGHFGGYRSGGGHFGGWGYRGHPSGGVYYGLGLGYGLGYAWPYYYPSFGSYYAYPPTVIQIPSTPPIYIQQGETQANPPPREGYWHYCRDPQGYYPEVQECQGGWEQVAPRQSDR